MGKHENDPRPWINAMTVIWTDSMRLVVGEHHQAGLNFPGGRIMPFEPMRDAAAREALEETGLRVTIGDQIGLFEVINQNEDHHKLCVVFWATVRGGTLKAHDDLKNILLLTPSELRSHDDVAPLTKQILAISGL